MNMLHIHNLKLFPGREKFVNFFLQNREKTQKVTFFENYRKEDNDENSSQIIILSSNTHNISIIEKILNFSNLSEFCKYKKLSWSAEILPHSYEVILQLLQPCYAICRFAKKNWFTLECT